MTRQYWVRLGLAMLVLLTQAAGVALGNNEICVDCDRFCYTSMQGGMPAWYGQDFLEGCLKRCDVDCENQSAPRDDWFNPLRAKGWAFAGGFIQYYRQLQQEGTSWADELPDCPCTNPDRDGIVHGDGWASEGGTGYHPGAAECFRSYPTDENGLKIGGPGQQCCYDTNGDLINCGAGAGTPDKVGCAQDEYEWWPFRGEAAWDYRSLLQHDTLDVTPFDYFRDYRIYHRFWPPNQGEGGGCPRNCVPPE